MENLQRLRFEKHVDTSSREGGHDRRLGVLIDEKNSWKCHVNMICEKPSAGIEPRGVSGI